MIEKLYHYRDKLHEVYNQKQERLDNADGSCADLEEQVESLDEILEKYNELIDLIEEYDFQWKGLKGIK